MWFQPHLDAIEEKAVCKGTCIGDKHVGTTGSHRDESDTLRLDGIAHRGS